jgi:hypothetical protein
MKPKSIKRKRSAPKPKPTALATTRSELLAAVPTSVEAVPAPPKSREVSEAAKQAFKNWMKEAFGTADAALQDRLFDQSIGAVPDFVGNEHKTMDHLTAALHGIGPQDELEGLLAVQLVSNHTLAMEFLRRAALPGMGDLGIDLNVNRATKLMRVFGTQVEALSRYRGKGEQKMIVEHVHVHKGGQAIVGPVNQTNGKKKVGPNEDN